MRCTLFLFCPKYYRKFSLYMKKTKKTVTHVTVLTNRDDWIRTSGPYVPNVVLYQTEPHPDMPSYGSCEKQRRWHVKKGGIAAFQRRRWDSNPRSLSESPVFKTGSLNHSDTSPKQLSDSFIITRRLAFVKHFFNFFQIFFKDFHFVKAVT